MRSQDIAKALDAAIDDLMRFRTNLDRVVERVHRDSDSGYKSRSFDPTGRPSGTGDPVGQRATQRRTDPVTQGWRVIGESTRIVTKEAFKILNAGQMLLGLDPVDARRLAEAETAVTQTCANCQRSVAGTTTDMLRTGRCQECYRYWRRKQVERPEALWGDHPRRQRISG